MRKRKWRIVVLIVLLIGAGLKLWQLSTESKARWTPDYACQDLTSILALEQLQTADYETLLLQTGLNACVIDALREHDLQSEIYAAQERFFAAPPIDCTPNSPISAEEHTAQGARLLALEDGDILITPCSHAFGWRNGHAALVVDASQGLTLESVVLGTDSCLQTIQKWETYPAVMVFRLRGAPAELRAQIAGTAYERLCGIPYGLTVGLLSPKYADVPDSTHCAHLLWSAYRTYGYDLDGSGGRIVTPRDLASSPLLELKQCCGVDPRLLWSS